MLRPIRRMTATAHEVTAPGSGRRIAIEGPPDELHDLADTIDGMLDRLDQSFASQRRFVADASHELRTPLAVITTEVDVALDNRNASSEDLRDSLRRVHGALGRTARLVESLLHLSRAEAAPIRLPHDLADSAEEAVAIVKRLAIAPPRTEADLASAPLSGDPVLLDRLVLNLVENACRYNIDGGFVRITTRLGAPAAERATGFGSFLVVETCGPVIDPEEVHRLFERFRRGSREANRRQGSDGNGLGLAIAKAVVDSHGGAITLAARPEGGLRVEVRFPGPCSA